VNCRVSILKRGDQYEYQVAVVPKDGPVVRRRGLRTSRRQALATVQAILATQQAQDSSQRPQETR